MLRYQKCLKTAKSSKPTPHLQFKNHNAAVSMDGNMIAVSTFTSEVKIWLVLRSKQGAPMGAGTVAQQVGDRLYIGSFIGDRMMSVPYVAK